MIYINMFLLTLSLFKLYLREDQNYLWVNTSFIQCTDNKLICDCEKENQPYVFIKFTDEQDFSEATFYGFNLSEPTDKKIVKTDIYNQLKILELDSSSFGYLRRSPSLDTLYYDGNNGIHSSFIRVAIEDSTLTMQSIWKLSTKAMTKAFLLRHDKTLENLIGSNAIACSCNKELSDQPINLVSSKSGYLIFYLRNNNMYIYKIKENKEARTVYPRTITKILLKKIHWSEFNSSILLP
jgi:hypothetical protein